MLTKYPWAGLKQSLELIGSVSKKCATAVLLPIGFCWEKVSPRIRKKKIEKKPGPLSDFQFRLLDRLELIQTRTELMCCRSSSQNVISLVNAAGVEALSKVSFHFREIFWSIEQQIVQSEIRGKTISWIVKQYPEVYFYCSNPLNTKRRLLYLKTQFVPRSKHFSSRL